MFRQTPRILLASPPIFLLFLPVFPYENLPLRSVADVAAVAGDAPNRKPPPSAANELATVEKNCRLSEQEGSEEEEEEDEVSSFDGSD
jgi:hypothetical protein